MPDLPDQAYLMRCVRNPNAPFPARSQAVSELTDDSLLELLATDLSLDQQLRELARKRNERLAERAQD